MSSLAPLLTIFGSIWLIYHLIDYKQVDLCIDRARHYFCILVFFIRQKSPRGAEGMVEKRGILQGLEG